MSDELKFEGAQKLPYPINDMAEEPDIKLAKDPAFSVIGAIRAK